MGNSANEALIIGVNVLIFIIALTISINLMSTVMEMSDRANEIIKSETGTMVESYQDKERIITGAQLLYYNEDKDTKNKYELYYRTTSQTLEGYLSDFWTVQNLINDKYSITYAGVNPVTSKQMYIFKEI